MRNATGGRPVSRVRHIQSGRPPKGSEVHASYQPTDSNHVVDMRSDRAHSARLPSVGARATNLLHRFSEESGPTELVHDPGKGRQWRNVSAVPNRAARRCAL